MPLNPHGKRQLARLKKTYGSTKRAKAVLYASKNKGKKGFTNIEGKRRGKARRRRRGGRGGRR